MKRKLNHIIFLVITGVILLLPAWNMSFKSLPDASQHEHRTLEPMPRLMLTKLDSFPAAFDRWYNDHFPFRNTLINGRMKVDIYGFRQSPIPSFVIMGKDDWLYNTGNEIEVYRGTHLFSQEELKIMQREMKERMKFIEEQGAQMVYVVIPTKYSIYPEHLPLNLNKVSKETRTDQFVQYMKKEGMPVIDTRECLFNAKKDTFQLFYKGDNHWNYHGAFVAYSTIMEYLESRVPGIGPPLKSSDFKITSKPSPHGNLSDMLYMKKGCGDIKYFYERIATSKTRTDTHRLYKVPEKFRFKENYEERYTNGNPDSPKILIIRDSFGEPLARFLKEHFRETVCIFDAWEYKLNPDIIKKEKPDVVMYLVLESFTETLLQ